MLILEDKAGTREGRIVLAHDAPIRDGMRNKTLCKFCAYAGDICKDIPKLIIKINDGIVVKKCSGFEEVLGGK